LTGGEGARSHPLRIYVATSWRNPHYDEALAYIRAKGHQPHDFKSPDYAFDWRDVVGDGKGLSMIEMERAYGAKPVGIAFRYDLDAMRSADAGLMLLPCGASAHAEFGYMAGMGKPVAVVLADGCQPETLHLLGGRFQVVARAVDWLEETARDKEIGLEVRP
jgi:hypothetical protein